MDAESTGRGRRHISSRRQPTGTSGGGTRNTDDGSTDSSFEVVTRTDVTHCRIFASGLEKVLQGSSCIPYLWITAAPPRAAPHPHARRGPAASGGLGPIRR